MTTTEQISSIVSAVGIIIVAIKQILDNYNANKQRAAVDKKVNNVAVAVQATAQRTDEVHTLVNSQKGQLLKAIVTLTTRIADDSGKPGDKEIAAQAQRDLDDHMNQQAIADKNKDSFAEGVKQTADNAAANIK